MSNIELTAADLHVAEKGPSTLLPSSLVIAALLCTPHSSGFRAPRIWTFLSNLLKTSYSASC
jgi:hypothetical protein